MPPIRNVSEIVVSTLMPISRAASGSCAVARIALPRREREMKPVIRISSGMVTPTESTSAFSIVTPKIVNSVCCALTRSGTPCWLPPFHSSPTFCRMNENPTAVISGASFGALRNGL